MITVEGIAKINTTNNEKGIVKFACGLVHIASNYQSNFKLIYKDNTEVDAKSILGLMSLAVGNNDLLKINIEGVDEVEAAEAITNYFHSL